MPFYYIEYGIAQLGAIGLWMQYRQNPQQALQNYHLAWNAAFVSLGGMVLYFVMLRRGSAARATANFYLMPGTAALLAWLLLGEALTPLVVVGLAVSSLGCALMSNRRWSAGRR